MHFLLNSIPFLVPQLSVQTKLAILEDHQGGHFLTYSCFLIWDVQVLCQDVGWEGGGLSKNADTADAGNGSGGRVGA